jgi:hypothetical protein
MLIALTKRPVAVIIKIIEPVSPKGVFQGKSEMMVSPRAASIRGETAASRHRDQNSIRIAIPS